MKIATIYNLYFLSCYVYKGFEKESKYKSQFKEYELDGAEKTK